jgi:hypothetical protein
MKRIVATLALVGVMAFPAAVLADTTDGGAPAPGSAGSTGGMSITIQSVQVTAKLVVRMQVAVTCQPRPTPEYPVFSGWDETSVQGYVRQASGKSIASGYINRQFDGDEVCDGSPHLLLVEVAADPAGVPFKSGAAVVAATGYASWYSENWETGQSSHNRGYASTGWVATRLAK